MLWNGSDLIDVILLQCTILPLDITAVLDGVVYLVIHVINPITNA
jgi:hypothetical protein